MQLFNRKFGPQVMLYQDLVEVVRKRPSPLLRSVGLRKIAADMMDWFERESKLESVSLVSVITAEVSKNADFAEVRVRHHSKLSLLGATLFEDESEQTGYLEESIPLELVGEGAFELKRTDPVVAEFLTLDRAQMDRFSELVFSLAERLDRAFSHATVVHDAGLRSAM